MTASFPVDRIYLHKPVATGISAYPGPEVVLTATANLLQHMADFTETADASLPAAATAATARDRFAAMLTHTLTTDPSATEVLLVLAASYPSQSADLFSLLASHSESVERSQLLLLAGLAAHINDETELAVETLRVAQDPTEVTLARQLARRVLEMITIPAAELREILLAAGEKAVSDYQAESSAN